MLQNPVFVAGILAVLAYGHFRLVRWLNERFPSTKPITFFSDYRKISLSRDDILYIESRDSEVWVFARDGQSYRNRNGITQWENLLGEGFLRIHRAFLVNVSHATLSTPDTVLVDALDLIGAVGFAAAVQNDLRHDIGNEVAQQHIRRFALAGLQEIQSVVFDLVAFGQQCFKVFRKIHLPSDIEILWMVTLSLRVLTSFGHEKSAFSFGKDAGLRVGRHELLQSTLFRTAKRRSKRFLLAILFGMVYDYIEQMFVFADSFSTLPAI